MYKISEIVEKKLPLKDYGMKKKTKQHKYGD